MVIITNKGEGMKAHLLTVSVLFGAFQVFTSNANPMTAQEGEALMKKSGCVACHKADKPGVGPSYKFVADRYKAPDAATTAYLKGQTPADYLMAKVRKGTVPSGPNKNKNWDKSPTGQAYGVMTPNPPGRIKDEDLKKMIEWILSL